MFEIHKHQTWITHNALLSARRALCYKCTTRWSRSSSFLLSSQTRNNRVAIILTWWLFKRSALTYKRCPKHKKKTCTTFRRKGILYIRITAFQFTAPGVLVMHLIASSLHFGFLSLKHVAHLFQFHAINIYKRIWDMTR